MKTQEQDTQGQINTFAEIFSRACNTLISREVMEARGNEPGANPIVLEIWGAAESCYRSGGEIEIPIQSQFAGRIVYSFRQDPQIAAWVINEMIKAEKADGCKAFFNACAEAFGPAATPEQITQLLVERKIAHMRDNNIDIPVVRMEVAVQAIGPSFAPVVTVMHSEIVRRHGAGGAPEPRPCIVARPEPEAPRGGNAQGPEPKID